MVPSHAQDILFRLRELSTQSSNGTLSNAHGQSLDKEAQGLQAEYGRILDTTSFNGIRVFGSGDVVSKPVSALTRRFWSTFRVT